MRFKHLDLIAAGCIAAINVVWVQIPARPMLVGVVLALPLVFFVPGYTLVQTLFHKRALDPDSSSNLIVRPGLKIGQPIGAPDHIVLSLGLSMAIDVVAGFALNVLPIGLQSASWTVALGLVTTVFALLATFLRRKNSVKSAKVSLPAITIHECILLGLALLIASLAVWSSIIRPAEVPESSFTQFWMLPTNNNNCAVQIGVHSFEATDVTYRIVMTTNGKQLITWSSIVLAPQAIWDQAVAIKSAASESIYVEARLYRADTPGSVYRDVHLTLHSLIGSNNGQRQTCSIGTR